MTTKMTEYNRWRRVKEKMRSLYMSARHFGWMHRKLLRERERCIYQDPDWKKLTRHYQGMVSGYEERLREEMFERHVHWVHWNREAGCYLPGSWSSEHHVIGRSAHVWSKSNTPGAGLIFDCENQEQEQEEFARRYPEEMNVVCPACNTKGHTAWECHEVKS